MRDVTPDENTHLYQRIKEDLFTIYNFLKNPIQKIKELPAWSIQELVIIFFIIAASTGALRGIISLKFFVILYGVIVSPIVSAIMLILFSVMFYYYFQIFENRTEKLKELFIFIFFCNIPFFLFQIGSEIAPPFELVGFAFTAILLIVGLTDTYKISKKRSIQLVSILFGAVFLIWIINKIDISRFDR